MPRTSLELRAVWAFGLAAIAASAPAVASAQSLLDFWVPNGPVNATAYDPIRERLYVGGRFDRIGAPSGAGALFHTSTGAVLDPLLRIGPLGSVVRTAVADGSGGWFIGGSFAEIQGALRQNLAHLDASGNLTAWNPGADGPVHSLALSGGVLYAGGAFATLAGATRTRLGAIDPTTGAATAWAPTANDTVKFVGVFSSVIYAGGDFTQINGTGRNRAAALSTAAALAAWNPNADGTVRAIYRSGTNIVLGGDFQNVGGSPRPYGALVNSTTGAVAPVTISTNGPVRALEADATRLFIGGDFTSIGGSSRTGLAAFNLGTLAIEVAWNANLDGAVRDLFVRGSQLYVVGDFEHAGGGRRGGAAAVSAAGGVLDAWDPRTGSPTYCVGATATNAFAGGGFVVVNYENSTSAYHLNLAVYDFSPGSATFGRPLPISFDVYRPYSAFYEGHVQTLSFDDPYLYVGGAFERYNGVPRANLAKSHVDTWATEGWAPNPNSDVRTIEAGKDYVAMAGYFSTIGAFPAAAPGLAVIDEVTGSASYTPPHPSPSGTVHEIVIRGMLYLGGYFDIMAGAYHRGLAASILGSSTVEPLDPFPPDSVTFGGPNAVGIFAVEPAEAEHVFVGGSFYYYGVFNRMNLLEISLPNGGLPSSWSPNPDGHVQAMARAGSRLYVTGGFGTVFGEARPRLAAFDVAHARGLLDWSPTLFGASPTTSFPRSIAAATNRVAVGGDFHGANGVFNPYLAVFDDQTPDYVAVEERPRGRGFRLGAAPNPVRRSGEVSFTLAEGSPVSLEIVDIQGRVMGRPLAGLHLAPGEHRVSFDATTWAPGVYLARLRAGDHSGVVRIVHAR